MNIWHTVDRAIRAILRFLNEAPWKENTPWTPRYLRYSALFTFQKIIDRAIRAILLFFTYKKMKCFLHTVDRAIRAILRFLNKACRKNKHLSIMILFPGGGGVLDFKLDGGVPRRFWDLGFLYTSKSVILGPFDIPFFTKNTQFWANWAHFWQIFQGSRLNIVGL